MRWFFLFVPFLFLSGCREKLRIEKFTAFGIVIDKDTEPIKIAEVLIKALDEENEEVLKKLVAVNAERKYIIETFKKYHQKPKKTEDESIRKLVSSGWLLTYNFFQKGFTNIVSDKVGEDSAFVFASGLKVNGERRTIEIKFVKENGCWRILGGLKEF